MALVAALALTFGSHQSRKSAPGQPVGLFTSLPILWAETPATMLHTGPPHWARTLLESVGPIHPIDSLADNRAMAKVALLVMAQPRALSPQENIALDAWVRAGGRLLLFADPMLTAHSQFSLGDKRRPRDVVLLSPILSHWGLSLHFDEAQPAGAQVVQAVGAAIPVQLAGSFALMPGTQGCRIESAGLVARCVIGRGRVLAVADAALLEDGDAAEQGLRGQALRTLVEATRQAP